MKAQIRFQPTLFIFVGTSAGQVGWRLKKLLREAYGEVPVLRFLWADIDTDISPLARPWFTSAERVELSGLNPAAVIKNIDNYPTIKEWWPESAGVKAGMLAGGGSPQQMRLIGRLALFRMFNDRTRGAALVDQLRGAADALFEIENIRATESKVSDRAVFAVEPGCRVVIVFSTCGGTGSSMSFDLAYLCRYFLRGKNPTVIGVAVMPPVMDRAILSETITQQEKIRANAYAWFKEDNYLSENPYWGVTYPEGIPLEILAPPFNYRFIIDIENQANYRLNATDDVYTMIAQSLFMDTGSSVAGAMRGFTANVAALGDYFEGMRRSYSSLAAASLIFPKERLRSYCAARLGRSLLVGGLLGRPDEHPADVAASTLLAHLRLRDADLLNDLLEDAIIKMQLEPSIHKTDTVAAAVSQIDAQETQNAALRRAEVDLLGQRSSARVAAQKAGLDQEIAKIAATRGIAFALLLLEKLSRPAPAGSIDPDILSLDGFKARIIQQGAAESDLEAARQDFTRAREALRRLDDGPEDVLERVVNPRGWKKKFALFKRDCLAAAARINEVTLQLAAQQQAAGLYDQLAALAHEQTAALNSAAGCARLLAGDLAARAERLGSRVERDARGYEFAQEIEIDFSEYYLEQSAQIEPAAVFSAMIPSTAQGSLAAFNAWTAAELPAAVVDYAARFFTAGLDSISLLGVLKRQAEQKGMEPQALVEEQLRRLVEYCHPFWQYDKDSGLNNLEGKSIIGVEDEDSPLLPAAFRSSTLYEIKTTGFRDRIDVVRVQHGLPAFLIRGMDEYKAVYDRKRNRPDPLHVLPGMEFAPDLMPEQGKRSRQVFALALGFGYVIHVGTWYYFDPEKAYLTHKIQPGREYRLAQGREKAEEVFAHRDEWVRQVENQVESEVRQMGNDAAIRKLEECIEARRQELAKMKIDDPLRKQTEREIEAFKNMERRLGKIG